MRCRNCGWENPDTNANCEKCGTRIDSSSADVQSPSPMAAAAAPSAGPASPLKATIRENDVFRAPANPVPPQQATTACSCCGYPLSPSADICPACGAPAQGNAYSQNFGQENRINQTRPESSFQQPLNPGNAQSYEQPKNAPRPANYGYPAPTVNELPQQGLHCTNCGAMLAPNARFCASCGAPAGNQPPQMNPRPKKPFGGTIAGFSDPGNMGMGSFCTLKPIAWARERIEYQPISYTGERIILNRTNTDANNQTITSNEQASLTFKNGEWYLEDLSPNRTTMIRVSRPVKLQDGDIIMLGNRMFEFNK